jgi:hypothetical protein
LCPSVTRHRLAAPAGKLCAELPRLAAGRPGSRVAGGDEQGELALDAGDPLARPVRPVAL